MSKSKIISDLIESDFKRYGGEDLHITKTVLHDEYIKWCKLVMSEYVETEEYEKAIIYRDEIKQAIARKIEAKKDFHRVFG